MIAPRSRVSSRARPRSPAPGPAAILVRMRAPPGVLAIVLCLAGCDRAAEAQEAATKAATAAADHTQKAVDEAGKRVDEAGKRIDEAGKRIDEVVDETKAATGRAWAGLTDTGELSTTALAWMKDTAESTDIRAVVAKGVQVAPVALEVAKTINGAVDSDTAVEPIYQSLDGRDPAEVDRAIGSMPRVEIVDGLKVGFHELSRLDAGTSVNERAYLMTWRREDHIVGLVYRTTRTIDLDKLVKEAPRLIALTQTALAAETP